MKKAECAYQRLSVNNPTIEELRTSRIPDECLDILVAEMKDVKGNHYTVTYYPNDVHGAYISVLSTGASSEDVQGIARILAEACRGWVDERGLAEGHKEEIVHFPEKRNPYPKNRIPVPEIVTQVRIAETIETCRGSLSEVRLVSGEYNRIPHNVYVNIYKSTPFHDEKQ